VAASGGPCSQRHQAPQSPIASAGHAAQRTGSPQATGFMTPALEPPSPALPSSRRRSAFLTTRHPWLLGPGTHAGPADSRTSQHKHRPALDGGIRAKPAHPARVCSAGCKDTLWEGHPATFHVLGQNDRGGRPYTPPGTVASAENLQTNWFRRAIPAHQRGLAPPTMTNVPAEAERPGKRQFASSGWAL